MPRPILVLTPHITTVPNVYVKVVWCTFMCMYTQADDVIMGLGTGRVPGVRSAGPRGNRTSGGFFCPTHRVCSKVKSRSQKKNSVGKAVQYCRKLHLRCLSSFTASAYRSHGHVSYGPARTRQRLGGQCSASAPHTPNCRLYGHLPPAAVSPRLARTVQHGK